jgi:hypothetical protein
MGEIAPAPENACKKIWGEWAITPIKKMFVQNNLLNDFIHFQLQNNAPIHAYAFKFHLK